MLTSLVSLLPSSTQPYAKTLTAALVSILTVLATTLEAAPAWLPIVLAILSAPAVYAVPNLDPSAVAQDESTMPPEASLDGDLPFDEF